MLTQNGLRQSFLRHDIKFLAFTQCNFLIVEPVLGVILQGNPVMPTVTSRIVVRLRKILRFRFCCYTIFEAVLLYLLRRFVKSILVRAKPACPNGACDYFSEIGSFVSGCQDGVSNSLGRGAWRDRFISTMRWTIVLEQPSIACSNLS